MNKGVIPLQFIGNGGTVLVQNGAVLLISSSGVESPGDFQILPSAESTSSIVPVSFWVADFNLLAEGQVVFEMVWNVFFINNGGVGTIMGHLFTAEVDGTPLTAFSGNEDDYDPGPTTWVTSVRNGIYQAISPVLATGNHQIEIFWQVYDADCAAAVGIEEANLRIERK